MIRFSNSCTRTWTWFTLVQFYIYLRQQLGILWWCILSKLPINYQRLERVVVNILWTQNTGQTSPQNCEYFCHNSFMSAEDHKSPRTFHLRSQTWFFCQHCFTTRVTNYIPVKKQNHKLNKLKPHPITVKEPATPLLLLTDINTVIAEVHWESADQFWSMRHIQVISVHLYFTILHTYPITKQP